MAFKKGFDPNRGGGMPAGKKTKKTLAKENAVEEANKELRAMCRKLQGKSFDEICDFMEYDPAIHAMLIVTKLEDPAQQKGYIDMLLKRKHAEKKSVDTTSTTTHTISIVMGNGEAPHMFTQLDAKDVTPQLPNPFAQLDQQATIIDLPDDDDEG
jgi:hypothetical protein